MRYLLRSSDSTVRPCDEETALQAVEDDPGCHLAPFGTANWVTGATFREYGEIAFEDRQFRAVLPGPDLATTDLLVTTETFPPYTVAARLGIVAAERIRGINLVKDLTAGLSDIFGGSSETLQAELATARKEVLDEMKREAASRGAHGLIALDLDFSPIDGKGVLMLLVTGTATAVTFSA